ncbi:MAG: monovalent cation/H+ antiporter complex subunit F [Anaerolineae bacterium]|nr:monovalent cation/H+ antiporter complex subunit F [Anaerolineae bacterium]
MSDLANAGVQIALVILIGLLVPCVWRMLRAPNAAERLQAIDLLTTLLIGIVVVLALVKGVAFVVDIGIALAAFSFIGTLAIARYLSDGRLF